ncbi:MAG: hypothetical protein M1838_001273 [Thelocarpon superellum]|nr:MAG: hypothetical protein M1838_001273 [Thelocarpon superellum]
MESEEALAPTSLSRANRTLGAVKDIGCGSVAGLVGKVIEYPFDTVKVRLQSQPEGVALRYQGPLDCFRQSLRQDGVLGLYRGISAPLLGAAIETSSLFFSYRIAQNLLASRFYPPSTPLPLSALIVCGAASGAFTSLALTPIELVKCQMQIPWISSSSSVRAPGPLAVMASVYRHHGLLGFWRGQVGTLIRETGGSAAWFGTYEGMSILLRTLSPPPETGKRRVSLSVSQQMFAGAVAGVSYNFLFFPADTIKSRMQTEELGQVAGKQRGFAEVGGALWRQQGLRGLYQGCGITMLRSGPSSAFIFAIYETLRSYCDQYLP